MENEKDLKTKLETREKELQENFEEVKNKFTVPSVEIDATSLSKAMSQVNLKDVELKELTEQEFRRDNFEKRTREEGSRGKMSRTNELEYQISKAGG